jgi:hypothetical protein
MRNRRLVGVLLLLLVLKMETLRYGCCGEAAGRVGGGVVTTTLMLVVMQREKWKRKKRGCC